jgi:hypothetical protein
MLEQSRHELRPRGRRRELVAEARDQQEAGIRDLAGECFTVRRREERVVGAVHHEGRCCDVGELLPGSARRRDGPLVGSRREVDRAVEDGARDAADAVSRRS